LSLNKILNTIGDAPRHLGNKLGCKFIMPLLI
jgi:hypothetical protein